MISLLKRLFLKNWLRKLLSLILAMIVWMVVSFSMTTTKPISNLSVRVINLPPETTIEGMLSNGLLNKKIELLVTGNKLKLEEIDHHNLEVVIDASNRSKEWIETISKKNLVATDPDIDLFKAIKKVTPQDIPIKKSQLIVEKIPILVTHPIGEAPKGYEFLDFWPYQLSLTVKGPEEAVKQLKHRGVKLTFNLNEISRRELDTLETSKRSDQIEEVSFHIPNSWKKISIPYLSDTPFEIDDPQARALRIDFSKQDLLPIGSSIPITIFFPPKFSHLINPEKCSLLTNDFIAEQNGIHLITTPLYVQGVSRLFLDTVKDMVQVVVIASPKSEKSAFLWNAQFTYPHELENRYVARVLREKSDEIEDVQPHMREDYLRSRFRSYMDRFRLYTADHKKLSLKIELKGRTVSITPTTAPIP